jgi:hypothetical protein
MDLVDTETERAAFVAFARKNDLLVEVENPDPAIVRSSDTNGDERLRP